MSKSFTLIFMGTPDFAVPALKKIHDQGHTVALVVTQPDRPRGRGKKPVFSPVKQAAISLRLPVLQPERVNADTLIYQVAKIKPDFIVVVAYGQILPQIMLDIPRFGAINIHASLLPKYRGPAPIQWAIINGEEKTGVCTMAMAPGVDTGDILISQETVITPGDTATTLHDRLALLGAEILMQTLDGLAGGKITPRPQDHAQATHAPMLKKDDGRIPWEKSSREIYNFIRGMTPWPGAFTFHNGKRLKIFSASILPTPVIELPGTVMEGFTGELRVATGEGALSILEIQGESGKRLPIGEFLRGHAIAAGDSFN